MEPSDDDVPRLIRRRDDRAFDRFYSEHAAPLLRYLRSLVRDEMLSEDLVQETMLRVVRSIDRYEERGTFRAWVFRIATNLAMTELRRRRFLRTEPIKGGVLEIPDHDCPGPEADTEASERRRIVEVGLGMLPDEQRAVFLLRAREGMAIDAIAEALCIPPGTVKSRLYHAVRKLGEFVAGCEAARKRKAGS